MKMKQSVIAFLMLAISFAACKKDNETAPERPIATLSNVEVGLGNNGIGTIGKDFHLNAEVLAGDRIETVQIKILSKAGETYSKEWKMEITWEQYKGAKNATVHKHFDIPADAPEGKFDFLIIVNDQNGTKLEQKNTLTLYTEANVPVNPSAYIFNMFSNDKRFIRNGKFSVEGAQLNKGDVIQSQITLSNVKGDGKMYLLFINKKLNHKPESIDKIDFSKVIVYDVVEHKGMPNSDFFSNATFDLVTNTPIRQFPSFTIGTATDNNLPQPNAISGVKAWESGTYYYGVVYHNSTYNMGFYQYMDIPIEIK